MFTVKRTVLPILIVLTAIVGHSILAICVLILCLASVLLAFVPGVYESRYKAVVNVLLELYALMVGCTFTLHMFIDDEDTQLKVGSAMIMGYTVTSVIVSVISLVETGHNIC